MYTGNGGTWYQAPNAILRQTKKIETKQIITIPSYYRSQIIGVLAHKKPDHEKIGLSACRLSVYQELVWTAPQGNEAGHRRS